jgi:stress response protein SCP2
MSINLVKGGSIDLRKTNGSPLENITVGLGWSMRNGVNYDLDASVYMQSATKEVEQAPVKKTFLGKLFAGKETPVAASDKLFDTVSYEKSSSRDMSIFHQGDNLVGSSGNSDDEQIKIDLKAVAQSVNRLVVGVNIYDCGGKHFGKVKKAYVRLFDNGTKEELVRYNLADEYSGKTAIIVGALERTPQGWKFVAIGKGSNAKTFRELGREA